MTQTTEQESCENSVTAAFDAWWEKQFYSHDFKDMGRKIWASAQEAKDLEWRARIVRMYEGGGRNALGELG